MISSTEAIAANPALNMNPTPAAIATAPAPAQAEEKAADVVIGGMPTTNSPSESTPWDDLPNMLTPAQAAACVGYTDRDSFLRTAEATGLRVARINARVLRIDKQNLKDWLDKRAA